MGRKGVYELQGLRVQGSEFLDAEGFANGGLPHRPQGYAQGMRMIMEVNPEASHKTFLAFGCKVWVGGFPKRA